MKQLSCWLNFKNSGRKRGCSTGWAAVFETAGRDALPDDTRVLVRERIAAWNGEDPGLSRGWVQEAIARLDETAKPVARLALLTALAPYQVDAGVIEAFRAQQPKDDRLIAAAAWASFTAARRIGTWLHAPAIAFGGWQAVGEEA